MTIALFRSSMLLDKKQSNCNNYALNKKRNKAWQAIQNFIIRYNDSRSKNMT